jgi:hypothetical protein
MKHFLILLIPAMLICGFLTAGVHENAGNYGYKFLNISTNPIGLALGGRGIQAGENSAAFLNQPAIGAMNHHRTLAASHTFWLEDTKFSNVAYSFSNRRSHFGLALRNLDYGEIEARDDNGNLIGYYSPLDMSIMANYAYRMGPDLYVGFNGGLMYQKLNTDSSYGIHADAGFTYLPPFRDSRLSLSIRNLGTSSRMNDIRTDMPVTAEMDFSKKYSFETGAITIEASAIKAIDENWKGVVNSELDIMGRLFLRGAYKIGYDAESVSAGLGIRVGKINVDYGWAAFTRQLNDIHSFGISYSF